MGQRLQLSRVNHCHVSNTTEHLGDGYSTNVFLPCEKIQKIEIRKFRKDVLAQKFRYWENLIQEKKTDLYMELVQISLGKLK